MADDRVTQNREASFPSLLAVSQSFSSTAVALSGYTEAIRQNNRINCAWITALSNDVLYRFDGSSPTTTLGHSLPANQSIRIEGVKLLAGFRAIGAAGASAQLFVTFYNTALAGGIR